MCQPVGAIHESPVFSNGQNPNKTPVCHPERSRSFFERIARKNREPLGKRDLATTLGGFLMGCYIDSKATQICSEIPSKHEVLFGSCLFASLNPQKFDFAQDDIQWLYSLYSLGRATNGIIFYGIITSSIIFAPNRKAYTKISRSLISVSSA